VQSSLIESFTQNSEQNSGMHGMSYPPSVIVPGLACVPEISLTIKPVNVTDLLDCKELIAEYAAECSIPAIGQINPSPEIYEALELTGIFRCFGVFDGERLVGFATILTTVFPHYGRKVATVESLFVASASRKGVAGTELLAVLDGYAKDMGCVAILYSTPSGGRLEKLLSVKKNCKRTNAVFCRSLR
jgi:GNAT superfamily N-acetyltransferase